jgi:cytochrome c peroxidase
VSRRVEPAALASTLAVLALCFAALALLAGFGFTTGTMAWSKDERAVLASMHLQRLGAPPADPSNAVADDPRAAALGRRLFNDPRLSRNGAVSCASCHAPERQFQDGLAVAQGIGSGRRRTMPLAASARSPWLFWDGRKDSAWSQALGPLEDAAEHGGNRLQLVRSLLQHYPQEMQALFGAPPALPATPADAGPLGTPQERQAWQQLTPAQRDAVNRVFAQLGKSIAAYERTLGFGESRFDRYVQAVLGGDASGQGLLSPSEQRGLRLFIGRAQCASCHNGPLLSDQHFHNTGVPPRDAQRPDAGRASAITRVQADEFNCLGPYSDAPAAACGELAFMATDDPHLAGAFKTPGLRNVAQRAPYMHAGQLDSLDAVLAHYRRAPDAALGHSELARDGGPRGERAPIRLSEAEARDIVAFLGTLSGPLVERPPR